MKKKEWKSPEKAKTSPRNSNARGMPKSQERVTTKIKWVYPRKVMKKKGLIKEKRQKKRWKTQRVELLIAILSLWNLETLFEPYESFSFIAKNHSLHYVPVEVLSNQASKQPGKINNAIKIQRVLFIRVMTSRTSYSLLFILIKWVFKRRQIFLRHNLELFLEQFTWKPIRNRRSPHDILLPKKILPNKSK